MPDLKRKRYSITFRTWIAIAGALALVQAAGAADSSFTPPAGYRDWPLISVAAVGPPLNDVRAKLGNEIAMKAFREGTIPYPDGAIIARLAWKQTTSEENNTAFRLEGQEKGLSPAVIAKAIDSSFVAGAATNVQFMVKDSAKYASTGGWGFFQFTNGKLDSTPAATTCFACHAPNKARDFVFTRYTP